jgi:hypothetical protein
MSKRLLALNAALGVLSAVFLVYIVRVVATPVPRPTPTRSRTAPPPARPSAPPPPTAVYGVIASRNLFSPARSEALMTAGGSGAPSNVPKPSLYGIVLRDGAPIAYLEDPVTKRVAGYRVGDAVAGGTVQTITADHVVVKRPEGSVDVRLHDPAKPRPAPTPPTGAAPTPGGPAAPLPTQPLLQPQPQTQFAPPPPALITPPATGAPPPGMPPNLRRRIQPGSIPNAPNS